MGHIERQTDGRAVGHQAVPVFPRRSLTMLKIKGETRGDYFHMEVREVRGIGEP